MRDLVAYSGMVLILLVRPLGLFGEDAFGGQHAAGENVALDEIDAFAIALEPAVGDGDDLQRRPAAWRQPVAQRRPGGLGGEVEVEPLGPGEAQFVGRDQRGRIAERNVAELEPHPSRSAVVTIARAMSAILRFSFMALRRSCLYASSSDRPRSAGSSSSRN